MLGVMNKVKSFMAQDIDFNNNQYSEKVIAALVGDPENNGEEGILIDGKRSSHVFMDVIDLDYKSMYPFIKIKNNIERVCQYFRIIIEEAVSPLENRRGIPIHWRGGELIEDYSTKNFLAFAHKWFGFKTIEDYIAEYMEFRKGGEPEKFNFELKDHMKSKYTLVLRPQFRTEEEKEERKCA